MGSEARDEHWLRYAFALAERSVQDGDFAFGAVLVDGDGQMLLESGETVWTRHTAWGTRN